MSETTKSTTYTEAHRRYYERHKKKIRDRNRQAKRRQNREYYDRHRLEILQKQKDKRKQKTRESLYSQTLTAKD